MQAETAHSCHQHICQESLYYLSQGIFFSISTKKYKHYYYYYYYEDVFMTPHICQAHPLIHHRSTFKLIFRRHQTARVQLDWEQV